MEMVMKERSFPLSMTAQRNAPERNHRLGHPEQRQSMRWCDVTFRVQLVGSMRIDNLVPENIDDGNHLLDR